MASDDVVVGVPRGRRGGCQLVARRRSERVMPPPPSSTGPHHLLTTTTTTTSGGGGGGGGVSWTTAAGQRVSRKYRRRRRRDVRRLQLQREYDRLRTIVPALSVIDAAANQRPRVSQVITPPRRTQKQQHHHRHQSSCALIGSNSIGSIGGEFVVYIHDKSTTSCTANRNTPQIHGKSN